MTFEVFDGRADSLIDLNLFDPGIAFDVNDAIARQEIVIEFLSPADVQDGVS